MGSFQLYRSNRVERLAERLAELFRTPAGGPFDPELVAVPGRGMSIWLARQLAERFGVWATPFVYPRALVDRVVEVVLGPDALGEASLGEDLLEWGIRAELPRLLAEPDFAEVSQYLATDARGTKLGRLAGRLARAFDQYLTYRPDWIRSWEGGGTAGIPEDQRFQAALFRRVRARLGQRHVAHLEERLLERLEQPEILPGLPPRIALFGLSTLPPLFVRVLARLSRHTDIHFFSFSAAPVGELGEAERPFYASLAPLAADFEKVLRDTLEASSLPLVEHDLHERPLSLAPPSVVAHACHSAMREVEVLFDQLLALTTRAIDPVRPEEIAVLMTSVETYAPLVEAVFRRERADPRFIPFHVSDRARRSESPIVEALLRVLGMVRGRVTAADVVDLLALGPVERRLGLDPASTDRVKEWVAESGVRWGMDAEHRASLGLPARGDNTWRFGISRILLGYAMPGNETLRFGEVVPYDEIEGKDAELAGTLAAFVRRLFAILRRLETPRTLPAWAAELAGLAEALFSESPEGARELAEVRTTLDELARSAGRAGFDGVLDVAALADLIESKLGGRVSERGFLAEGVTFSAMVPMRSIPFRVVAVLGLNDGEFPRVPKTPEFDLLHDGRLERREGDRSPRVDDRYLFLETLGAAREQLQFFFIGRSVKDDRLRPPSVCLTELIEYLAAREGLERTEVERQVLVAHPLQGFSPKYFDRTTPELESFAIEYERAARMLLCESRSEAPFVGKLEPLPRPELVTLDELCRFWKSPARSLLNRRLGVYLESRKAELRDREPIELDALDQWKLGEPLIGYELAELPEDESARLLSGLGRLPWGHWGSALLEPQRKTSRLIAERVRELRAGPALPQVPIDLAFGTLRLVGGVDARFPGGVVVHTYSKASPKRLLELFMRQLALDASGAGLGSFLVTRGDKREVEVRSLSPLDPLEARARLERLVTLYLEGQARALAFAPRASFAYAEGAENPERALEAAIKAYETQHGDAESDPHFERAFDHLPPPFDAAFERGERRLLDTDFHAIALAVTVPLVERLEELS